MFKKIFTLLQPGGIFLLGDLMTYRQPKHAAYEQARHFHHLVERASNRATLEDWAHHHLFINQLTPVEDQMEWLRQAGFRVKLAMQEMNTMVIVAAKPKR
jgi:cyclopropane fatty-acyl-phospholipid synthase-like methyltransferase